MKMESTQLLERLSKRVRAVKFLKTSCHTHPPLKLPRSWPQTWDWVNNWAIWPPYQKHPYHSLIQTRSPWYHLTRRETPVLRYSLQAQGIKKASPSFTANYPVQGLTAEATGNVSSPLLWPTPLAENLTSYKMPERQGVGEEGEAKGL